MYLIGCFVIACFTLNGIWCGSLRTSSDSSTQGATQTCGDTVSEITQDEQEILVRDHNRYRSEEAATNMLRMSWDDALASRAQDQANSCTWGHSMLYACDGVTRYGQNIFALGSGTNFAEDNDVGYMLREWANEKLDYTYENRTCRDERVCGHYTQVVWYNSNKVGCVIRRCPNMIYNGENGGAGIYLVCNYYPAGNHDKHPFKQGPESCSDCSSILQGQSYSCRNNLCESGCEKSTSENCVCSPTTCQNGEWSETDCKCRCISGFYGNQCEKSCVCENVPGYQQTCLQFGSLCENASYKNFMTNVCPKTCGYCEAIPEGACD